MDRLWDKLYRIIWKKQYRKICRSYFRAIFPLYEDSAEQHINKLIIDDTIVIFVYAFWRIAATIAYFLFYQHLYYQYFHFIGFTYIPGDYTNAPLIVKNLLESLDNFMISIWPTFSPFSMYFAITVLSSVIIYPFIPSNSSINPYEIHISSWIEKTTSPPFLFPTFVQVCSYGIGIAMLTLSIKIGSYLSKFPGTWSIKIFLVFFLAFIAAILISAVYYFTLNFVMKHYLYCK